MRYFLDYTVYRYEDYSFMAGQVSDCESPYALLLFDDAVAGSRVAITLVNHVRHYWPDRII